MESKFGFTAIRDYIFNVEGMVCMRRGVCNGDILGRRWIGDEDELGATCGQNGVNRTGARCRQGFDDLMMRGMANGATGVAATKAREREGRRQELRL
jgi:hypothetical protein